MFERSRKTSAFSYILFAVMFRMFVYLSCGDQFKFCLCAVLSCSWGRERERERERLHVGGGVRSAPRVSTSAVPSLLPPYLNETIIIT
jgi:hypothetical protein